MIPQDAFFVDFPFRAQRSYVHSASIANHWADLVPQADRFEFVFKSWMDCRVRFRPIASAAELRGTGNVKITHGSQTDLWEISADTTVPVQTRVPYDEDAIPVSVDAQSQTCRVPPFEGRTFFDRLIRGNKALIDTCLAPAVKLVASKIVVNGVPGVQDVVDLRLKSHVGNRIFKTTILSEDIQIGEVIYLGT